MREKLRLDAPLALLAISLFLAPLIGGQISLDSVPGISGLMDVLAGGSEAPLLTHALLTLPIVAAFALLMRRQVVQVPNAALATMLFLFFGVLSATVLISSFRMTSLATAAEWLAYALAFLTVVGSAGRRIGPIVVMTAIFSGCVLLALRGLMEYGEMKSVDPTWRIFAGWVNPNATAAMLLVGFFLGLTLLTRSKERLLTILTGVGVVVVGLAIVLTQSKGALAVLGVSFVAFACLLIPTARRSLPKSGVRIAGVMLALVALAVSVNLRSGPPRAVGAGGALSRVTQVQATSEQSAGFRTLLWKGAGVMVRQNAAGHGIGTYRYESGRSGLHTQTVLTHNAFLQLATEGSPVLPAFLLIAGGIWLWLAFRGWRSLPPEVRAMQAGVLAATMAVVGHSLIDSDLYYFGVGLSFFTLIGLGLLLSADAVAPEFAPKPVRGIGIVGGLMVAALLTYVGVAEFLRAQARGQIAMRDLQGAAATLATLRSFAPFDGEAWYLSGQVAPTDAERLQALTQAVAHAPSTRNQRSLARQLAVANELPRAITHLRLALIRDPNNLLTLSQLAEMYDLTGDEAEAKRIRQRLVAVEQSSYFLVRSLPELVPTETYRARIRLAKTETGRAKAEMLQPAIDGFMSYLQKTVPMVKRMAEGNPPSDYGGEDVQKAQEKLALAAEAARELAATYRALGEPARAEAAEGAASAFSTAFDK